MKELRDLGLKSCSYLIGRNEVITSKQFADRIRAHSSHPRVAQIADAIEAESALLENRWNGVTYQPENDFNFKEIAARNAGLHVVVHPNHLKYGLESYQVAAKEIHKQGSMPLLPTDPFSTKDAAWDAAYAALQPVATVSTQNPGDLTRVVATLLADVSQKGFFEEKKSPLSETVYYGTILADRSDKTILDGLGFDVGGMDDFSGVTRYYVRATESARRGLHELGSPFKEVLLPLPLSVMAEGGAGQLTAKPLSTLNSVELAAYVAYLEYQQRQHAELSQEPSANVYGRELSCANDELVIRREREQSKNNDAVLSYGVAP